MILARDQTSHDAMSELVGMPGVLGHTITETPEEEKADDESQWVDQFATREVAADHCRSGQRRTTATHVDCARIVGVEVRDVRLAREMTGGAREDWLER
jgi:hypothetical protein